MAEITIETADGPMAAYVALPAAGRGPGIIVIQEIFGVNQNIRDLADGLAAQGYIAVAPDLFWRIEPGIQLTDQSEAEWARAFELFNAFNVDKGIDDLKATLAATRVLEGSTGKVGAVGYCLGGKLAYLLAARSDIDASVGFYGVMIDQALGEAAAISHPLMLHIAGKDQFVPPPAQAAMHAGLDGNALVTLHDYPDDDHAFARIGGAHYSPESADAANARTLAFFRQHLA